LNPGFFLRGIATLLAATSVSTSALQHYINDVRGNPPSDYVFISKKTDGPLDPAVWNRLYKSYVLDAGLPVTSLVAQFSPQRGVVVLLRTDVRRC